MEVILITDFNSIVHGTFNDKKTGCGINLQKAENSTKYRRGTKMTDLKEITCEKCSMKIAKAMIKADKKEMDKLLKEEKQREKLGLGDEGIVPLGNTTAKITSTPVKEPVQASVAETNTYTPDPEPPKSQQTIPGTGVPIDNDLAQFAINVPKQEEEQTEQNNTQDDFLAQFAIQKPQEEPEETPAPANPLQDNFLAQFAIPAPSAPETQNHKNDVLQSNSMASVGGTSAIPSSDDIMSMFAISGTTSEPEPVDEEIYQTTSYEQYNDQYDTQNEQYTNEYTEQYDNSTQYADAAGNNYVSQENYQYTQQTEPQYQENEWDKLANQLFGVNNNNSAEQVNTEPETTPEILDMDDLQGYVNSSASVQETAVPPVIEDIVPPVLENTVPPVIEDIAPPVLEDIVPPVLEDIAPPVLEDIAPPVLEDIAPPVLEDIAPPVLEDIAPPVLEDIASPVLEDIASPVLEDISVSAYETETYETENYEETEEDTEEYEEVYESEPAPEPVKEAPPVQKPAKKPAEVIYQSSQVHLATNKNRNKTPVQQQTTPQTAQAAPVQQAIPQTAQAAPVQQAIPQTAQAAPVQQFNPQAVPPVQNIVPPVQAAAAQPQFMTIPQFAGYDQNGQPVYTYTQMQITGYDPSGQPMLAPLGGQPMQIAPQMQYAAPYVQPNAVSQPLTVGQRIAASYGNNLQPTAQQLTVGQKIAASHGVDLNQIASAPQQLTVGQKIAAEAAAKGDPVTANVSKIATNPHSKSTSKAFINAISESKEYANQSLTDTQGLQAKTPVIASVEDMLAQLGDNSEKEKKMKAAELNKNIPVVDEFKAPSKSAPKTLSNSKSSAPQQPARQLTAKELREKKKQEKIDAKFRKEMEKRK